jgi:dUTP pyrophosphatase
MTRFTLYIKTEDSNLQSLYSNKSESHKGDSGIDLYTPEEVIFLPGETKLINLQIKCQMIDNITENDVSYYLYPRSSISKTPLRLANSVGIIDAGYRGNIMVALTYIPTTNHFMEINGNGHLDLDDNKFVLAAGTRIVQICSGDLTPVNYKLKNELTHTDRGENGFGSTGGIATNV